MSRHLFPRKQVLLTIFLRSYTPHASSRTVAALSLILREANIFEEGMPRGWLILLALFHKHCDSPSNRVSVLRAPQSPFFLVGREYHCLAFGGQAMLVLRSAFVLVGYLQKFLIVVEYLLASSFDEKNPVVMEEVFLIIAISPFSASIHQLDVVCVPYAAWPNQLYGRCIDPCEEVPRSMRSFDHVVNVFKPISTLVAARRLRLVIFVPLRCWLFAGAPGPLPV